MIALAGRLCRLRDTILTVLPTQQILELFSRASAEASKSTALAPLHWMLGLSISGLLVAAGIGPSAERVVTALLILVVVAFVAELLAYCYFLFTGNIDALRTERFIIKKMQIERGMLGDSTSGFREIDSAPQPKAIPVAQRDPK